MSDPALRDPEGGTYGGCCGATLAGDILGLACVIYMLAWIMGWWP